MLHTRISSELISHLLTSIRTDFMLMAKIYPKFNIL
jgi:hypothetical protein